MHFADQAYCWHLRPLAKTPIISFGFRYKQDCGQLRNNPGCAATRARKILVLERLDTIYKRKLKCAYANADDPRTRKSYFILYAFIVRWFAVKMSLFVCLFVCLIVVFCVCFCVFFRIEGKKIDQTDLFQIVNSHRA